MGSLKGRHYDLYEGDGDDISPEMMAKENANLRSRVEGATNPFHPKVTRQEITYNDKDGVERTIARYERWLAIPKSTLEQLHYKEETCGNFILAPNMLLLSRSENEYTGRTSYGIQLVRFDEDETSREIIETKLSAVRWGNDSVEATVVNEKGQVANDDDEKFEIINEMNDMLRYSLHNKMEVPFGKIAVSRPMTQLVDTNEILSDAYYGL